MLSTSKRLTGCDFFGACWTGSFFGVYWIFGRGWAHSSGYHSILIPLYTARDIIQVRAKRELWTELRETSASPFWKLMLMTTRLWMWSRSSRRRSSVMFGWTFRIAKFRVAPIPILFATWPGRINWRSFQENSSYQTSVSSHLDQQSSITRFPWI